jgi:hypothetical protein
MRIRTGFVSNSSSTSFLIISRGEFTRERFLALVGVTEQSPLFSVFDQLFDVFLESISATDDFGSDPDSDAILDYTSGTKLELSTKMKEQIEEARQNGMIVRYGLLSSDGDLIEQFFCCESFELNGDGIYINSLNSTW